MENRPHERNNGDAETDARNRGLQEDEADLRDPDKRTPRRAVDHDAPDPDPSTTPQDAESDVAHLENPPQTEGPRERSNNGV